MNFYKAKIIISKPKFTTGFTLVEMMVAIAVFSIVMVTAMSALLNVVDANNKARAIKTAINNISFALEGISKDMRMGTEYACGQSGNTSKTNCTDGVDTISFKSSKTIGGIVNPYIYYKFVKTNINDKQVGQIFSCISNAGTGPCNGGGGYSAITSTEVNLTSVKFYILGVEDPDLKSTQPRMLMTVRGEAGSKEKIKTTFDLQTGVSQINRPE